MRRPAHARLLRAHHAARDDFTEIAGSLSKITVLTGADTTRHAYRTLVTGEVNPNEPLLPSF